MSEHLLKSVSTHTSFRYLFASPGITVVAIAMFYAGSRSSSAPPSTSDVPKSNSTPLPQEAPAGEATRIETVENTLAVETLEPADVADQPNTVIEPPLRYPPYITR